MGKKKVKATKKKNTKKKTASASTSSKKQRSKAKAKTTKPPKKVAPGVVSMNFSMNAESVSPAPPEVVAKNQEQIDMIVNLLEGVRTDFVTRHIKDDLDRIQMLVKNITYREAGDDAKVVSVHFTNAEKVVIKQVCGMAEANSKASAVEESDLVVTHNQGVIVPKLTYPFVKLNLVPTRLPADKKNQKKKKKKI